MDVGRKIGHALGGAVDIVIPKNGSREGTRMRLEVMMNIKKLILRGKLITLGLETVWVEIRYETYIMSGSIVVCLALMIKYVCKKRKI